MSWPELGANTNVSSTTPTFGVSLSLSVKPDPSAPDGFICHSFAGDDWDECKDYVRNRLGLGAFAANRLRKALRALMKHAIEIGLRSDDPSRDTKAIRVKSEGYHSWSEHEIERFETTHPIGSRARLAFSLLLYTGQRRSDVTRMGRQHIRNGLLHVKQQKTGAALAIPVHPTLAAIIADTPAEHMTFITTIRGHPFGMTGFGKWFREACDAAGLPHCTAHGLRKAAARRLAEAGCTEHEIAAITGHASLREVQRYTRAADQTRLAISAIEKVKTRTPK